MRVTIAGEFMFPCAMAYTLESLLADILLERGIAWAPACGVAMTELVLTGECQSINLKPFDPSRFTQKVSGRGRKKQGTDVGEQW